MCSINKVIPIADNYQGIPYKPVYNFNPSDMELTSWIWIDMKTHKQTNCISVKLSGW